ncbi:MAG: hypothetical protein AAFN81_18240 [Bacteroidota bacterium]
MSQLSLQDEALSGNATSTVSGLSELVQWLQLLAQGEDAKLPAESRRNSMLRIVWRLAFADEAEKRRYCLDLSLLLQDDAFPDDWNYQQLNLLLDICRVTPMMVQMEAPLREIALQLKAGLAFYPLLRTFIDNYRGVALTTTHWTLVLKLLRYGRLPEQFTRSGEQGNGLSRLTAQQLQLAVDFDQEQILRLAYFLEQPRLSTHAFFGVAFHFLMAYRAHAKYAPTYSALVVEFCWEVLPQAVQRRRSFRKDRWLGLDADLFDHSQCLFQMWLFHSHSNSYEIFCVDKSSYKYGGEKAFWNFERPELGYQHSFLQDFRLVSFPSVIAYLPPGLLLQKNVPFSVDNVALLVYLGAGKNIRKYPVLTYPMSKKAAHTFHTSLPSNFYIELGLGFNTMLTDAYLRSLFGAGEYLFQLFFAVNLYWHFGLEGARSWVNPEAAFEAWSVVLPHLVAIKFTQAGEEERVLITSYLRHLIDLKRPLRLKGCTLASLTRQAIAWDRTTQEAPEDCDIHVPNQWKGAPYANFIQNAEAGAIHQIVQVTDADLLHLEGKSMRHCVASYQWKCVNGWCSI